MRLTVDGDGLGLGEGGAGPRVLRHALQVEAGRGLAPRQPHRRHRHRPPPAALLRQGAAHLGLLQQLRGLAVAVPGQPPADHWRGVGGRGLAGVAQLLAGLRGVWPGEAGLGGADCNVTLVSRLSQNITQTDAGGKNLCVRFRYVSCEPGKVNTYKKKGQKIEFKCFMQKDDQNWAVY